jgi:hypothetical protein
MKKIFFIIVLVIPFFAKGQLHVNFSVDGNYWEHTDLYGLQGGLGFEYRKNKLAFRSTFNFGYGEYNRFKDFDFGAGEYTTLRVDYAQFQTIVGVNVERSEWMKRNAISLRDMKTDYARQHQFDLLTGYKMIDKGDKLSLWVYGGLFASMIDHFYVIDVFQAHELDAQIYFGTLNAVVYSDQRFYTIGGQVEIAGEWKYKNTFFAPYIKGGLGPNYTSFGSVGFRITGAIRR